jgi:SGNH domain (fused to AT3 domains)
LIIFAATGRNPVARALSLAPVRLVGLCSYSFYLVHWPLFSFAHLRFGEELLLGMRISISGVSFILAYLSWRFIETPFRKRSLGSWKTFGAAGIAMASLYLAGTEFWVSDGFPSRVSDKVLLAEAGTPPSGTYCKDIAIPTVRGGTVCETGADRKSSYDFVLWGDSHAFHFTPAIDTLAKARKLSGIVFSRPACFPFLGAQGIPKACRDFDAAVALWIEQHPVKLVMLGGRWGYYRKQIREFLIYPDPAANPGGLAPTLAFLNSRNITVSVLDQVPEFPENVSRCVARAVMSGRSEERCFTQPTARFRSQHKILDDYFEYLGRRYSFSVASAAGAICQSEWCHAADGNAIFMSDNDHLTQAGALHVMSSLSIPLLSGPGKAAGNFTAIEAVPAPKPL